MNKKMSIGGTLVVFASLLTYGCSSLDTKKDDIEAKGQKIVHQAYAKQSKQSQYKSIRFTDRYYVPELTKEELERPAWWLDSIQGKIRAATVKDAMSDYLTSQGIIVRYLDGIADDQSIMETKLSRLPSDATLGDLVKHVGYITGLSFEPEPELLTWSKFQIKRFKVNALLGGARTQYGSEKKEQGSQGGFGSMSRVESGFDSDDNFTIYEADTGNVWSNIEGEIKMLLDDEGQVAVNKSTASVLVKGIPQNVAAVERHIKEVNEDLGTVVVLDIELIEFESNESLNASVDWSIITDQLKNGSLGFTTGFSEFASDMAPTMLEYTREEGKYAGSKALIQALNQNGVQVKVTRKRAIATNNYPTKNVYGNDTAFLEEGGSSSTANVGTNQRLKQGVVRTGDQLYMLPSVNEDDVFITVSASLNKLNDIRKVTSNDSAIEAPEVGLDEMITRLKIRDGDTLVLSNSVSEQNADATNNGFYCLFLGCSTQNKSNREERLILITPRVKRD